MFSFLFSYFTGVLAALNPCTVPIYPLMFSYYLQKNQHVSVRNVISFVAGFLVSFLVLATILIFIGTTSIQEFVRFVAAGVVALLAIHFLLKGFSGAWLESKVSVIKSPFLFGAVFGLALNPCALPLFLVNLTVTSINAFNIMNVLLFGAGVATPPLLAAIFGTTLIKKLGSKVQGFYTHMHRVVGIFLLLAAGILVWYVAATPLVAIIASTFIFLFFAILIAPLWKSIWFFETNKKQEREHLRNELVFLTSGLILLWGFLTFHCFKVTYTTQFACSTHCTPCMICVAALLGAFLLGYFGYYLLEKKTKNTSH